MSDKPTALRLADELDKTLDFQNRAWSAAKELRRLHDEVEALRFKVASLEAGVGAAARSNDALRADAERYRWMKQEVKRIPPGWELIGWDAAIDAARSKT